MSQQLHYGVAPIEAIKSYDGIGFLKAIIAGEQPHPPICAELDFHLIEAEPGRAAFEGVPKYELYNPINIVHGGWAATLLDSAMGCAIFSLLTKGESWTTLELKVNYVRAITKDTGAMRAQGRIIHRGRQVATSEGDLRDQAGTLYAHATTTCMIFAAKS